MQAVSFICPKSGSTIMRLCGYVVYKCPQGIQHVIPICITPVPDSICTYGISTYIWLEIKTKVGKYSMHGASGCRLVEFRP